VDEADDQPRVGALETGRAPSTRGEAIAVGASRRPLALRSAVARSLSRGRWADDARPRSRSEEDSS
jgi:hypothetical protein